ncbi:MAG TPA: CvpA family protein [Rhodocyclaceae bacterium]|nr:CvpA family protein [Rhodocyclaceae bacterium]
MADFTWFDYLVFAVIALSSLLGMWRGVVSEVLALLAWVAAFFAAKLLGSTVAGIIGNALHDPSLRQIVGFITVFVATLLLFAVARLLLSTLLRAIGLGVLDRMLGTFFGIGRGILVVLVLVLLGGMTELPSHPAWRNAALAPPLETAVVALKPYLPQALTQRIHYRGNHAANDNRRFASAARQGRQQESHWL